MTTVNGPQLKRKKVEDVQAQVPFLWLTNTSNFRHGLSADGKLANLDLKQYLSLKLIGCGLEIDEAERRSFGVDGAMLDVFKHQEYLLRDKTSPADARIQQFLDDSLKGLTLPPVTLPSHTLILDQYGMARELSLPQSASFFKSNLLSSYRLRNGVLHNPASDRRTTAGSFHIADGGLPVAADKKEVPLRTFGFLLHHAVHSCPSETLQLPFAPPPAETWVSVFLRPVAVPEVPGWRPEKRMEVRLFAPGSLVANLDFVESIFGNWGDPRFPVNDAGLDVEHWTGTTGCIILAPHLKDLFKKDVGLPHISKATARQKRDGMCWESETEKYNDGQAFKICHRTASGVIVTILADNYFGYCKKEVKTHLSYTCNLIGLSEEEHAGGALTFYQVRLGSTFRCHDPRMKGINTNTFDDLLRILGDRVTLDPAGFAVDKRFPDIIYVPETVSASLAERKVQWTTPTGEVRSIKLLTKRTYVHPSGFMVYLERHPRAGTFTLIGVDPRGTFCHKPCTVSGGGKSEISKSMDYAMQYCNMFVADLEADKVKLQEIFDALSERFGRNVFDEEVTPGSMIRKCCPSPEWDPAYNAWLQSFPDRLWTIAFAVKRHYKKEWGANWQSHFHVDVVNGARGNELLIDAAGRSRRPLLSRFLRMGNDPKGGWRTFTLRQDFQASFKVQMEDDISTSVVVPTGIVSGCPNDGLSRKIVVNCEMRLFQRPDDAVHRGFDRQTEADMAEDGLFTSNFEPLRPVDVQNEIEDPLTFDAYTELMQQHLLKGCGDAGWLVSSALTRVVGGGKRTTNPRYLQLRSDVTQSRDTHIAGVMLRLDRRVPVTEKIVCPVDLVLPGRRNNPPTEGIRMLAVYNPIHYQDLPELFIDFISSLTGKSPSTTGAGSEGALTKGPFNALATTADLNNALVGLMLTGHAGYTSAAGFIGPNYDVGHDITSIIPEIFCRLTLEERDPQYLIREGHLEAVKDFEYNGRTVPASLLGYRITAKFARTFLGKLFTNPAIVFPDDMLRPELQDLPSFVDGIDNLAEAHAKSAAMFFEDGTIADACPPLQALLHIMKSGSYKGLPRSHPDVRRLFTREYLLASDWYHHRLVVQQQRDVARWQDSIRYLETHLESDAVNGHELNIAQKLHYARDMLKTAQSPAYLQTLHGTMGADPIHGGK